jgi:hypothetical protein
MDETACNYDETANIDDGSCFSENACGSCEGDESCLGCTDTEACNYSEIATIEDGSCAVDLGCGCGEPAAASGYDCEGNLNCAFDFTTISYVDGADGVNNWNSENSWTVADADGNILWDAAIDFSYTEGDDVSISLCLDPDACYTFTLNDSYGDGWNGNSLDAGSFNGPDGPYTVFGGFLAEASNCVEGCTDSEISVSWGTDDDYSGFAWSIFNQDGAVAGGSGEAVACLDLNTCYSVQIVPPGSSSGQWDFATVSVDGLDYIWTEGSDGTWTSDFNYILGTNCPVAGCLDDLACNYAGEEGFYSDFTLCEYPDFGYDCEGSCLEDADADGICDANDLCPDDAEDSCVGCTDETASNYNADATVDDGSCYMSVSCADEATVTAAHTYGDNDSSSFSYFGDEGSFLELFISGESELCCDEIYVYNGAGEQLWTNSDYEPFSTLIVSSDNGITVAFDSDGSVSGFDVVWTVSCVGAGEIPGCTDETACN